jgi:hypothetical protein
VSQNADGEEEQPRGPSCTEILGMFESKIDEEPEEEREQKQPEVITRYGFVLDQKDQQILHEAEQNNRKEKKSTAIFREEINNQHKTKSTMQTNDKNHQQQQVQKKTVNLFDCINKVKANAENYFSDDDEEIDILSSIDLDSIEKEVQLKSQASSNILKPQQQQQQQQPQKPIVPNKVFELQPKQNVFIPKNVIAVKRKLDENRPSGSTTTHMKPAPSSASASSSFVPSTTATSLSSSSSGTSKI